MFLVCPIAYAQGLLMHCFAMSLLLSLMFLLIHLQMLYIYIYVYIYIYTDYTLSDIYIDFEEKCYESNLRLCNSSTNWGHV